MLASPKNPQQNIQFSIPYFRPDSQNVYPISDPVMCGCVFFFVMQCQQQHVTATNGIPDETDGIYTLFQTKMAKSMPYFRLEMLENARSLGPYDYTILYTDQVPAMETGDKQQMNDDFTINSHYLTYTFLLGEYTF